MDSQPLPSHTPKRRPALMGGIILIAIGVLALLAQLGLLENLGVLFLPVLGALFLIWGLSTRTFGLVIPGGILSGIGLGIWLLQGPLADAAEPVQGAVFMLAFAAGWGLIALLSRITADTPQWWPLIPGGILAAIGGLLLAGETGIRILELSGYAWPVFLIALGLWILWRRRS